MIQTNDLSIAMAEESMTFSEKSSPDMEDIRLSLSGDGAAYERLVVKYQSRISARMWRFTRDRFEHGELVQDVFVEAYMSLKTFRSRAPFEHWLSRIATGVGYKYWKRKAAMGKNQMIPMEAFDWKEPANPETLTPENAAEILYSLLERLPPRDRLVLTLRYVEDLSLEETAQLTGWSVTMVKVQSWRARKKLKKLFESAGLEVDR